MQNNEFGLTHMQTWLKGLNIKAKTMQFSGVTGIKLYDLGLGNGFLDITANAQK